MMTLERARRSLYDLANILERLKNENWDNAEERKSVLLALETHSPVLRDIAKLPELFEKIS